LSTHPSGAEPEHLREASRMIEEFRVALFAQPVGALGSPSVKRITALLNS
jgi:hypothetical protein